MEKPKDKWQCDYCKSEKKPPVIPGLVNQSWVTVAEFCGEDCREKFLRDRE